MSDDFRIRLQQIVNQDVATLVKKEESYGSSWKKRGGVGAFMMLARKWDRIEEQAKQRNYDIFRAIESSKMTATVDDLLDDIRDLRNYLTLVEEHVQNQPRLEIRKIRIQIDNPRGFDPTEDCTPELGI